MALGSGEVWPHRHLLITERLKTRRELLGLTQKQVVARLAKLGVRTTNRTLSNLEHGAGIDVARLPELASALECTVTYLMGLTQSPHRWSPDPATDGTVPLTARPPSAPLSGYGSTPPLPSRTPAASAPAASPSSPASRPGPEHDAVPTSGDCLILGSFVPDRAVRASRPSPADG